MSKVDNTFNCFKYFKQNSVCGSRMLSMNSLNTESGGQRALWKTNSFIRLPITTELQPLKQLGGVSTATPAGSRYDGVYLTDFLIFYSSSVGYFSGLKIINPTLFKSLWDRIICVEEDKSSKGAVNFDHETLNCKNRFYQTQWKKRSTLQLSGSKVKKTDEPQPKLAHFLKQ